MKHKKDKKRVFITCCFILYLVLLLFTVLFLDRSVKEEYQYNLVFLSEIKRYIHYREQVGDWIFLRNILGNVVGFIPMGALWPYVFPRMKNPLLVTLVCFEWSLVIEVTQLVLKIGSFDVDDLLLNTAGGFVGCVLYYLIRTAWRNLHAQKK